MSTNGEWSCKLRHNQEQAMHGKLSPVTDWLFILTVLRNSQRIEEQDSLREDYCTNSEE